VLVVVVDFWRWLVKKTENENDNEHEDEDDFWERG
jgi:hypothetical protein